MLISPIQGANNQSFKSLKIDFVGLYKKDKYAEHANLVLNSLKKNQLFADFCKKNDVEVIFNAHKAGDTIYTIFDMYLVKPTKSKLAKFFGFNMKNIITIKKENVFQDYGTGLNERLWLCSQNLSSEFSSHNEAYVGELSTKINEINKQNKSLYELKKSVEDMEKEYS